MSNINDLVIANKSDLVAIADTIRNKLNTVDTLSFPNGFIDGINNIIGETNSNDSLFGDKLYSFGVISDIHIDVDSTSHDTKFDNALTLFKSLGAEMVCSAGDITNHSNISELAKVKSICDSHSDIPFHTCNGNHDKTVTDENWLTYLSHDRHYEVIHKNDVFLFMSLDYNYTSSSTAYTTGMEWVKNRLNRYKGSRIFLFMHFPPSGYSGLVEGQYYGFSSSSTQDDELITLLNQTKNVTVFNGHTHYAFDVQNQSDEINVFRFNANDVNLIHVPSCGYTRDVNFESISGSEGWLVDVYEKGFALNGYNLKTGELIDGTEYYFPTDNVEIASNVIVTDMVDVILHASETAQVNVSLAEPDNTTVNISVNNSAVTVSPSTLTFTEDTYNIPQVVTISAPASITSDASYLVTYAANNMKNKTTSVTLVSTTTTTEAKLARKDTWYKSTTPRSNITEIQFVNTVDSVPTTYSETWDASDGGTGDVTAFIDGTKLYIAGNGSSSIVTNKYSDYAFSDSNKVDYFSNVTSISGLGLLDTSNTKYFNSLFKNCQSLTSLDLSNFNTTACTDMHNMFEKCSSLTSLNISSFNASNVTDMSGMFDGCTALTSLDLSNFDTSNVTTMYYMFNECSGLTSSSLNISKFNTSKVESFECMFAHCSGLTELDLSHFDTSSATIMLGMFYYCTGLTSLNVSSFNTTNVVNMSAMFGYCESLASLDVSNFVTTDCTNMADMFRYCKLLSTLSVSNFNTSNVTTMYSMFKHCETLTSLDLSNFVTTACTNMADMFYECINLTSLNVSSFDTSKVTIMAEMFSHCDNLATLDISNFDTRAIPDSTGLYRFARKSGITNLTVGANFVQETNIQTAGTDGMFYTSSSTPLTITGANDVLKTYDFATDNRTVTFAA